MPARALLLSLVLLLLPGSVAADYLRASREAIVREDHRTRSAELARLRPGETVDLASGRKTDGYYHVELPDGTQGWVYQTFVRRVPGEQPRDPNADDPESPRTGDGGGERVQPLSGARFRPPCELPFASLAQRRPIDDSCDPDGSATTDPQREQNKAKNNFCASGSPSRITFQTLTRLQQTAEDLDIPHGSSNRLPADRSVLHGILSSPDTGPIGEGSLVRLSAFLLDAHYSNVSKGESVNCKETGQANNDIHIAVAASADEEDLCNSVTAEISPHFRPSTWEPSTLNNLNHHPVRLTGQLFFDGSHAPCRDGRGSPRRASVWEIHPVYAIDVCRNRSLDGCDANDDSKWVRLEEWLNLAERLEDE